MSYMSHFSRIKTCINNETILKETLADLKFDYEYIKLQTANNMNSQPTNILVKNNNMNLFEFIWDGLKYSFVADLQFWKYNIPYEQLLEKIIQKYSYNAIMQESIKQGFMNINEEQLKDGSIKLIIQRWSE
uniref:Ycf35 n=1 Tax=Anunuuluaehu liula TaxID=3049639 RepID=UPI0030038A1B